MAKLKLDKTDRQILRILQENCNITNLELSKKIGLSPAPTLERVKKLELKGVISSYHAHLDPKKLDLKIRTFIQAVVKWEKPDAMESLMRQIQRIDQIIECYVVTGEADVLMKVVCRDIQSYEQLLFTKLSKIEEISQLKTMITLSQVKDSKVLPMESESDR